MENHKIPQSHREVLARAFPDPHLLDEISKQAIFHTLPAGQTLLGQGDEVAMVPIVLSGSVKVSREEESGKEILLYYIEPLESCVLSLSAVMTFGDSQVTAIAENDLELLLIPGDFVRDWMSRFPEWSRFIFELYNLRMMDVLTLVEAVTFKKADDRLWEHLLRKKEATGSAVILITHNELAHELGTIREVISRLLKSFERKGLVSLNRGQIILNSSQKSPSV